MGMPTPFLQTQYGGKKNFPPMRELVRFFPKIIFQDKETIH